MKPVICALLVPASLWAQSLEDTLKRGEQLFAQTCGSGYCHGGRGAGGGAPRLAARGFTQSFIASTVSRGVPGTAMPAFGGTLPPADLNAIVVYVALLNNIQNLEMGAGAPAAEPKLSTEAARGRALFSDAARGFGRCSTCHEVGGLGIPVTAPVQSVPENAAALRALATPRVVTATAGGETMPALVVANKSASVTFYDLTAVPPVLRTELPSAVRMQEGSVWRHANVMGAYSDVELNAVLAYLRAQLARP